MMPGVTYLPVPSSTMASVGAVTLVPTSAILPSRRSRLPPRMVGPAAVRIVTLRINVGRDANGRYVLGKGSAFGSETPPRIGTDDVESAARARVTGAPSGPLA